VKIRSLVSLALAGTLGACVEELEVGESFSQTVVTCGGKPCVAGVVVTATATGVTVEHAGLGVFVDTIGEGVTVKATVGSIKITAPATALYAIRRTVAGGDEIVIDKLATSGRKDVFVVKKGNVTLTSTRKNQAPLTVAMTGAGNTIAYGGEPSAVTLGNTGVLTLPSLRGLVVLDWPARTLRDPTASTSFLGGTDWEYAPVPDELGGQDFEFVPPVIDPLGGQDFEVTVPLPPEAIAPANRITIHPGEAPVMAHIRHDLALGYTSDDDMEPLYYFRGTTAFALVRR